MKTEVEKDQLVRVIVEHVNPPVEDVDNLHKGLHRLSVGNLKYISAAIRPMALDDKNIVESYDDSLYTLQDTDVELAEVAVANS